MQFSSALSRAALTAVLVATMTVAGCGEDKVEAPSNLYLRVTSDATPDNLALGSLRILMTKGTAVYPSDATAAEFNPTLGTVDIRSEPLLLSVAYDGATFGDGDAVTVEIVGLAAADQRFLVRGEASVNLGYVGFVDVRLRALPTGCDTDGDGFFDCTIAGCCDAGSPFGDCEPDDASAHPWGTEDACEPCSDTVDQDCRGGDTACVDADNDQIADCSETECGLGDGAVGPGLTELCDGKDNNCDDSTDEGWTLAYRGQTLNLGDACGVGACTGGVVACDGQGGILCTGDANKADAEICYNSVDDDCNGQTDEACPILDADNDTFTVDDGDCNDDDDTIYPNAEELCDGKDNDCNDATDEGFDDLDSDDVADCVDPDIDGDTVPNETDNCSRVANTDQANVDGDLLGDLCDPCVDADNDGWGRGGIAVAECPNGPELDCDDTAGATTDVDGDNICTPTDNCPAIGNADQINTDGDSFGDACDPCIDVDGDGFGRGLDNAACPAGPALDCNDTLGNTDDSDNDNACGSNDNCPGVANSDQTDVDNDTIGDACDNCIDADGDGWGRGGLSVALCPKGPAPDCNDTVGNLADADGDNLCVGNDNCVDVANVGQENTDGDAFGDACDACIDIDGDGFGSGGLDVAACPRGPAVDCNDALGNSDDPDVDNVCGAADNCPLTANANQADLDNDTLGDACDPCVDADGDGWGSGGTDVNTCAKGPAVDCDDTPGNVADTDADNVCAPGDNCLGIANPDQTNTDGDVNGDACDVCIDVDGDGWGSGGINQAACPNGAMPDCDDASGNTSDSDGDNVCGASDNCPAVANPAQTDVDADETGDACDACVDVDGDGWGSGGTNPALCENGATPDCDDALGNLADPDSDNVCGAADNCPSAANADQANTDGDTFGDACDLCIDVDEDGFGRDGIDVTMCPGGPAEDCDDALDNERDPDGDNVCDPDDNCPSIANPGQEDEDGDDLGDACEFVCPGDADADGVCDSGRGIKCNESNVGTCDDNCIGTANPLQYDSDDDGFGDACDEPLEVCSDCIDNDNNGLTDVGDACAYRRYVAVAARAADIGVGHPISLTFDHSFLVGAGRSTASGADLRVYYVNPTTQVWEELDRVIDPDPGPNSPYTTLWFASQAAIGASEADLNYRLVYGGAVVPGLLPPSDPLTVFSVWDDFDRTASATVGGDWLELEAANATVAIVNNSLQADRGITEGALGFTSSNNGMRPVATLPFDSIDSGVHLWRMGWNWVNGSEGTYSVVMQLGDSTHGSWNATPTTMAQALGGSGPTIIWAGDQFGTSSGANSMFGYPANGVNVSLGVLNARTAIYVAVDVDNDRYMVFPSAAGPEWSDWIGFRTDVAQLDRLRVYTDGLTTSNFARSQFEYIGIQRLTDEKEEPFAFIGLTEPMACTTVGSPILRYYLDDADGSQTLADSGSGTAANLTVTTASVNGGTQTQPIVSSVFGTGALTWFVNRANGKAEVALTGQGAPAAKLRDAMDNQDEGTMEIVIEPYQVPSASQTVTFAGIQEGSNKRFTLSMRGGATAGAPARLEFYGENSVRATWNLDVVAARRVVLHAVYDDSVNASRFTLYRDGVAQTPTTTPLSMNDLDIDNNSFFIVGNSASNESPMGFIYYVAMYSSALSSAEALQNWRVLEANDDAPAP